MKGRQRPLPFEFSFAGFRFPRYLATLQAGTKQQRVDRYKHTGGYCHAPKPGATGRGFYLDDSSRWKWCDDVAGAGVKHTGWYTDEYGDGDKIRGIVVLLPHGRFLAGWSMGEGAASSLEYEVYTDAKEAAWAADSLAESVAEDEREYQEEQQRLQDEEEALGDPNLCPLCSSDQIEGGPVEIDGNHAAQECSCNECSATWIDTYTRSSITITDKGEN
jgi:hypothetical protein